MSVPDLAGKCILVVGGETEQGRAVVIGLAEAGADVAIVTLTADTRAEFAINSALNELWAMQRKGVALAIDAGDETMLRGAVVRAISELGAMDLMVVVSGEDFLEGIRAALVVDTYGGPDVVHVVPGDDPGGVLEEISRRLCA